MHYERVRRNGSALVTKRTPPSPDGRRSRAYNAWVNMRQRVLNPKHPRYANYGGRGIDIDPRWDSYQAFLEDMGEPGEGMSLGRIDNNRGYSLENCRWSTNTAQANNRTSNSVVVIYV